MVRPFSDLADSDSMGLPPDSRSSVCFTAVGAWSSRVGSPWFHSGWVRGWVGAGSVPAWLPDDAPAEADGETALDGADDAPLVLRSIEASSRPIAVASRDVTTSRVRSPISRTSALGYMLVFPSAMCAA